MNGSQAIWDCSENRLILHESKNVEVSCCMHDVEVPLADTFAVSLNCFAFSCYPKPLHVWPILLAHLLL